MNRTKVVNTIKACRENKALGLNAGIHLSNESSMNLVEALEEIASEKNIEALRRAISWLSGQVCDRTAEDLSALHGLLQSIQVPKEVVYAYPVTMSKHFDHFFNEFIGGSVANNDDMKITFAGSGRDGFGCEWRAFLCSKQAEEFVKYLRENNVPIKVCE